MAFVKQVMSKVLLKIDGKSTIQEAANLMKRERVRPVLEASDLMDRKHIRHLGVTDREKIVGVISVRDLLRPLYLEGTQ